MKATRANVEVYAKEHGLVPVQVDSIPEGFSFQKPDITIGDMLHRGAYVAFVPNSELKMIRVEKPEDLLKEYKIATI